MSANDSAPTCFINIFRFDGIDMALERPVIRTRAKAIEDAEEFADEYRYTLSDKGRIDLEPEFSEAWHAKKDADAAVDARIDEGREEGRAA
jgi:hypothetical protein